MLKISINDKMTCISVVGNVETSILEMRYLIKTFCEQTAKKTHDKYITPESVLSALIDSIEFYPKPIEVY